MDQLEKFLIIMAAFSMASQTLTEHLIKKRWATKLDVPADDLVEESRRQSKIHLYSGIIGALLAATTGLRPISDLVTATGHTPSALLNASYTFNFPLIECLLIGALVSFGGGFFNEFLGVLRQFKGAQEEIKKVAAAQAATALMPPTIGIVGSPGVSTTAQNAPDFDDTLPPLADPGDMGDILDKFKTEPYPSDESQNSGETLGHDTENEEEAS